MFWGSLGHFTELVSAFVLHFVVILGRLRGDLGNSEGSQRLFGEGLGMFFKQFLLTMCWSIRDPSRSHLQPNLNIFEFSGTP